MFTSACSAEKVKPFGFQRWIGLEIPLEQLSWFMKQVVFLRPDVT